MTQHSPAASLLADAMTRYRPIRKKDISNLRAGSLIKLHELLVEQIVIRTDEYGNSNTPQWLAESKMRTVGILLVRCAPRTEA